MVQTYENNNTKPYVLLWERHNKAIKVRSKQDWITLKSRITQ
jgi:hypothetical protein